MGFPFMVATNWWGKTAVRGCRCKFFKSYTQGQADIASCSTPNRLPAAGWWGKKMAVREYAPRRARSAAGSPAAPATALPAARPAHAKKPRFSEYWPREQVDAAVSSGQSAGIPQAWLTAGWQGQSCMKSAQSSSIEPGWH